MSSTLKILNKDFPFIPTDKGANFLICKEYNEVFLGVYEIECHGNKLIAESVDNEIKLDVEFDGKIYETYFQLKKGDEDAVIFSLKNLGDGRRIYKEEVEVVKSIVKEEALPDPEPLIESYEVVEEAKIDIEKYKNDAIKVINENFSNKKLKIEQLQESLTSLIDERLSELSSITANEVSNLKEDIIKSVDESISKSVIDRDKTLVEINSIKDDVSSTAEFWSNILISNAREKTEQLQSLKESVAFEIDTKIAELKSELKSQESHITEAYDSIQSFINKTKRELLEEKTSSYANLEQLQKQANLVVSENLKKADLLVGKKITQLQSTADKKINDLTTLVESRVSSFDDKVNEINSALERAGIALTESINEAVKNIEYKSQESAFKLDVEVQSKINELDKTKQELTTIAESQVVKLESKIKDVEDATNKAEKSLTTTVNDAVNKMQLETSAQTAEIDRAKNQLTSVAEKSLSDIKQVAANLTETVEKKVRDVTLVAVKKEDLAQLKKQLEARLDNESASLKKYVAGYGGGGSVAQQFAVGGTMNGTLNVASGQILSAGQDLFSLLGGGGGGVSGDYLPLSGGKVTGNVTVAGVLSTTTLYATSAFMTIVDVTQYELSGFNVTGNVTVNGNISSTSMDTNYIDFTPTSTPPTHIDGRLYYDTTERTLVFMDGDPTLTYPINKMLWIIGVNKTGSVIPKGTVVYLSGAQGNRGKMWPALATADLASADTIGITMGSTAINQEGYIMTMGELEGIDTRAFPEGTTLYLSPTAAGGITDVKPQAPNHLVKVGFSLNSTVNGKIYVEIDNGYEINELHNVRINGVTDGQSLIYNSTSALWVNSNITALSNNGNTFSLNSDGTYNISNDTISTGTNSIQLYSGTSAGITWYNSSGGAPGVDFLSRAQATTGAVKFTFLNGAPPFLSTKEFTLSSDGKFIFTDGTAQSTAFTGTATDTGVRALTGNWQNTYTNFSTQSANNVSVFTTVQTNSSTWTGGAQYVPASYTRWSLTGASPTVAFSIPGATSSTSAAYRVTIDYLLQDPNSYTIDNTADTITFSQAPPTGSEIIVLEETFSQVTAGDGAKWNSTYTTVNTNSATWSAPAASSITGTRLASNVVGSSLTDVGVLTALTTSGILSSGYVGSVDSSIIVAGTNTKGGAGYHDFLRVTNGGAGVTNPNKYFRLNNTGNLEIINSAYTSNILTLGNDGSFSVGGNIQTNGSINGGSLQVSGKQAVNGPAFAAYAAAILQTIPSGSQTKVLFQTEEFDTGNCFSSSKFTPNVEGYYQLNAEVRLDGASGTGEMMIVLYKNGSEYKRGTNQSGTQIASNFWAMTVSTIAYANGTTDNFEIYVQQGSGGNVTVTAVNNPAITWFNGCMLRGA